MKNTEGHYVFTSLFAFIGKRRFQNEKTTSQDDMAHSSSLRYAVAEWYGAGLAIARSWVRIPPVASAYRRQLSVPSLRGRLMNSGLRATG